MSIKRLGGRTGQHLCFPLPPLKFRTSGFPQYGFKLDVEHDLRPEGLIRAPKPGSPPLWPFAGMSSGRILRRSSPEALRSAAGYVVPPPQTLLWPHPSHSEPAAELMDSLKGSNPLREVPHFIPRVCANVPPSVPRRTERLLLAVASSSVQAFALSARARHPHLRAHRFSRGCVSRLQSSLHATARGLARPTPVRTFTSELSPGGSPPAGRRI